MSAAVFRAFGTPLYRDKIALDKKTINPILGSTEFRRLPSDDGWGSRDTRVLDNDFSVLKPAVQSKLEDFLFNHFMLKRKYEIEIQNSWIMKHKKGDKSTLHWHSNSLISGILYLQTDDKSGDLVFVSAANWTNNIFNFEYEQDNPLNQDTVIHTPRDGEIILFPSKTYHMVTPSQSEHSRFCLAFNAYIRGESEMDYENSIAQIRL